MLISLMFYGFMLSFSVVGFFADMGLANGAPQQAVAAASAMFTLFAPYTVIKVYQGWKAIKNQEAILEALKKISEHRQA
jgi:hypothetical protein